MTGLDPERDRIIEIASMVTDSQLNIVEEGPSLVIHQQTNVLEKMDDWNTTHHTESGLLQKVKKSTITERMAQSLTMSFIAKFGEARSAPLCGNSIWQDRRFLLRYMPQLEGFLHYRNIDVSSVKELVRRWYPELPLFEKRNSHTALSDIRESVAELKYYQARVFLPIASPAHDS